MISERLKQESRERRPQPTRSGSVQLRAAHEAFTLMTPAANTPPTRRRVATTRNAASSLTLGHSNLLISKDYYNESVTAFGPRVETAERLFSVIRVVTTDQSKRERKNRAGVRENKSVMKYPAKTCELTTEYLLASISETPSVQLNR